MEKIKKFLKVENNDHYGYGNSVGSGRSSSYGNGIGCGDGTGAGFSDYSGYGYGDGDSAGQASGCGRGSGYGYGNGYGDCYGAGDGSGSGYGWGAGRGCGFGAGYDYSDNIKAINGMTVVVIDGVQTIIKSVVRNLAKGFILRDDLTLKPCYVAKRNNLFAHGETAEEAVSALQEKIFESMDTDEVISEFLKEFELDKEYPAKDFYQWHHILTGSCEMGRNEFVRSHAIDLDNELYTVKEFIEITKNSYGGEVIKQLESEIARRIE